MRARYKSLSCRTISGQVELLARHIDYCTAVGMGEGHITQEDGTIRRAACMGGMLSMMGGECRLLATTFEWADAIDKERVERSKARAEAILAQKDVWMPVRSNWPKPGLNVPWYAAVWPVPTEPVI